MMLQLCYFAVPSSFICAIPKTSFIQSTVAITTQPVPLLPCTPSMHYQASLLPNLRCSTNAQSLKASLASP